MKPDWFIIENGQFAIDLNKVLWVSHAPDREWSNIRVTEQSDTLSVGHHVAKQILNELSRRKAQEPPLR